MSIHVALLGDSSFDNRTYTRGEPDVAAHLRDVLGAGSNVTLLAIDGSTTTDMGMPIDRVRDDVTHLVLSIGPRARVALRMFNDAIVRSSRRVGARTIDLRDVCSAAADFANPIEPSGRGGRKIAEAIARALSARAS